MATYTVVKYGTLCYKAMQDQALYVDNGCYSIVWWCTWWSDYHLKMQLPSKWKDGERGGQLNQIISFYSSVMVTMICQETKLEKWLVLQKLAKFIGFSTWLCLTDNLSIPWFVSALADVTIMESPGSDIFLNFVWTRTNELLKESHLFGTPCPYYGTLHLLMMWL